jgi:RNA polymerase sigma-70 factor, ECF subfamily
MSSVEPHTEELLTRAGNGDAAARNTLLDKYRSRLRALVAISLHRGMASRIDPSDVVQESLAEADGRLADYIERRPLPYYLWLRELTLERLVDLHRRHVVAQKRSVNREASRGVISDESMNDLAQRLVAGGSSPSQRAQREETRLKVREALDRLARNDREVLVLRHLEQLSTREIAAVLELTEAAVKVRHLRALQRLRERLGDQFDEGKA